MGFGGKHLGDVQNCFILHIMAKLPEQNLDEIHDLDQAPLSPFDRVDRDEADLWFLPGPPEDEEIRPLSQPTRLLFDPEEWRQAQGELSGELAELTLQFGALDARLGLMGAGVQQRLALREAADLSWWAGTRVGVERLALWMGAHLGGGQEDALALGQAGWAMRRLTAGQGPDRGGWCEGISAFLGRVRVDSTGDCAELAEVMIACYPLHPVTQSAVMFHAWRIISQGQAADLEAAVLATCHAASMGRGHARYLPLALSGVTALRATGSAQTRLAAWIRGAGQAVRGAEAELDRLAAWQRTAQAALSGLTGRTPGKLVDLFAAWPVVSAPMAEAQTGASRAAVQRNLDLFEQRGVIREITGQGRYRVWMARL